MDQRLSVITLGVTDVARARAFYEALGWSVHDPASDLTAFQAVGIVIALWGRAALAADTGVEDSGGWGGITIAHNVHSPREVDDVVEQARAAGARVTREPAATFWGGYSGVFCDLDGHAWEVAHNPGWRITADGATQMG